MRAPGDILLVSCYELGHQPFSLASPLATLTNAGYAPVAVDSSVQYLSLAQIQRARLVAISVPMHTALRLGARIAEQVRAINPTAHICFYGLYALLNSDYLLEQLADSVIGGEYEEPLLGLAGALERSGAIEVPGVRTRKHREDAYRKRVAFALPDRSSLPPLSSYAKLDDGDTLKLAGYTEASRGCLHTCTHCPITPVYGGRFFVVPPEVVLNDIRTQVAAGAQHITFGDPDFLNGPGHSMKILRSMHAEFPALTFDATIKIEHIIEHPELFPELRALGCVFVVSAVESVSDVVLERLKKGHTRADVVAALDILRHAGIPMRPSLLPFTPWTSPEDYVDLLQFVLEHDLVSNIDPVQYSIRLLVPPGSALVEQLTAEGFLGELNAEAFTYEWEHPDPRMDRLQQEIAKIAEQAQKKHWTHSDTFTRIRRAAYETLGRDLPEDEQLREAASAQEPPHLTEAWFCCAEPTSDQLEPLVGIDTTPV